jgi:uncharacterized protein (DUF2147 family)
MKKSFYLTAAAALLMATTSAHAGNGFSFEIGGQKIHIDAPKNCSSLNCVSVSNNGSPVNLKNINLKGKKNSDDDDVATNSPPPAPPAPAPAVNNPPPAPPAPPAPVANNAPPAPPAPVSDASRERISGLGAANDQPSRAANNAPAAPAPVASNAPPAQQAAPVAPPAQQAAPVAQADPTSPLGLWQTADNKGNVRIEPCGANLCGFAEHTNDRILINMKPTSDNKWTGRIHDPDSGSNYDSIISLKSPNLLKVQGCAFGGMFCGGQTWKRIG